jgi:hypothetical protein
MKGDLELFSSTIHNKVIIKTNDYKWRLLCATVNQLQDITINQRSIIKKNFLEDAQDNKMIQI